MEAESADLGWTGKRARRDEVVWRELITAHQASGCKRVVNPIYSGG